MTKLHSGFVALTSLTLTLATFAVTSQADAQPMDMGATVTRAEAQSRAEAMFAQMDANHDGKLDPADREARKGQTFDKMDADHNGAISRDEFKARKAGKDAKGPRPDMPPPPPMGMRPGMGMIMMQDADTNRDGAISKDEFVAASFKRFDAADSNHDGKVTPEERQAARAAMRAQMGDHRGM